MTKPHSDAAHGGSDGLWRWLLGGLIGGGVVLGLMIGAYAIGYNRGQNYPAVVTPATAPIGTTTAATTTTSTAASSTMPVPDDAALVALGETLYAENSCSACHSLDGSPGAGPSLMGAAGRKVQLTNGQTVTADDAYLQNAIADPDAQIVKGYGAGAMTAAISGFDLAANPDDIRALVAFIKSQE